MKYSTFCNVLSAYIIFIFIVVGFQWIVGLHYIYIYCSWLPMDDRFFQFYAKCLLLGHSFVIFAKSPEYGFSCFSQIDEAV